MTKSGEKETKAKPQKKSDAPKTSKTENIEEEKQELPNDKKRFHSQQNSSFATKPVEAKLKPQKPVHQEQIQPKIKKGGQGK